MASRKCAQVQRRFAVLAKEKCALESRLRSMMNEDVPLDGGDSSKANGADRDDDDREALHHSSHHIGKRRVSDVENTRRNDNEEAQSARSKYRKTSHHAPCARAVGLCAGLADRSDSLTPEKGVSDMNASFNIKLKECCEAYLPLCSFKFPGLPAAVMDGIGTTLVGSGQHKNRNGYFHLRLGEPNNPRDFVDAGHTRPIRALKLRQDLRFALSTAMDGFINISSPREQHVLLRFRSQKCAWSCDWAPDTEYQFCAGMQDGSVRVYDIRNTRNYMAETKLVGANTLGKPVVGIRYLDSSGASIAAADLSGVSILTRSDGDLSVRNSHPLRPHPQRLRL